MQLAEQIKALRLQLTEFLLLLLLLPATPGTQNLIKFSVYLGLPAIIVS